MLLLSSLRGIMSSLFLISTGIFSMDLLIKLSTEVLLRSSMRFLVSIDL